MARKLRPSRKIACWAVAYGTALAGGLYLIWPGMYWWVYPLVALVLAVGVFQMLLEWGANVRTIDRD